MVFVHTQSLFDLLTELVNEALKLGEGGLQDVVIRMHCGSVLQQLLCAARQYIYIYTHTHIYIYIIYTHIHT